MLQNILSISPAHGGNLSIVGLDIRIGNIEGLDAFVEAIYTGTLAVTQPYDGSNALFEAARRALADAALPQHARLALILAGNSADLPGLLRQVPTPDSAKALTGNATLPLIIRQAQLLLAAESADAVLLVAGDVAAAAAAVLAWPEQSAYAQIELTPGEDLAEIGYLEAPGLAVDGTAPTGLIDSTRGHYPARTCALGTLPEGLASTPALGGMAALVKAALCLEKRILPALPGWNGPVDPQDWEGTPFYISTEGRPWFHERPGARRIAAIWLGSLSGSGGTIFLTEATPRCDAPACRAADSYLLPVLGNSLEELQSGLDELAGELGRGVDLSVLANAVLRDTQLHNRASYAISLVGKDAAELLREADYARRGVRMAFEKQSDWQTPGGSYFTSDPQGRNGSVAFVYPGAFNSYIDLGKDLFYRFPGLHERISRLTEDTFASLRAGQLYPRTLERLSKEQLQALEASLIADPVAMLISGTCLAVVYTFVLREVFGIHPAAGFGYSLGENSMCFAAEVWRDGDASRAHLESSPLFQTRLAGPQNAVREAWGLPPQKAGSASGAPLWANYLLMITPDRAIEAIKQEPHVYLTHINTPRQVVIGGDPAACQRIVAALKCSSLRMPFNYALHCEPVRSEQTALAEQHTWPVERQPDWALYTAATYERLPMESQSIGQAIGDMLSRPLDFPRLVQRVYADGARIFIELGAGANCSKWIDESLAGTPHLSLSVNRAGQEDYLSLLRALGRLLSHRVPFDLSPLAGVAAASVAAGRSA